MDKNAVLFPDRSKYAQTVMVTLSRIAPVLAMAYSRSTSPGCVESTQDLRFRGISFHVKSGTAYDPPPQNLRRQG